MLGLKSTEIRLRASYARLNLSKELYPSISSTIARNLKCVIGMKPKNEAIVVYDPEWSDDSIVFILHEGLVVQRFYFGNYSAAQTFAKDYNLKQESLNYVQ